MNKEKQIYLRLTLHIGLTCLFYIYTKYVVFNLFL